MISFKHGQNPILPVPGCYKRQPNFEGAAASARPLVAKYQHDDKNSVLCRLDAHGVFILGGALLPLAMLKLKMLV